MSGAEHREPTEAVSWSRVWGRVRLGWDSQVSRPGRVGWGIKFSSRKGNQGPKKQRVSQSQLA